MKHSFYRLIIPYFIYNALLIVLFHFFDPLPIRDYQYILLGAQEKLPHEFVIMWYIVALFMMRIIMAFFVTIGLKKQFTHLMIVLLSIVCTIALTELNVAVEELDYFQLNTTFLLFPFFILGIYINAFWEKIFKKKNTLLLAIMTLCCLYLAHINGAVNTFRGNYGNHLLLFYVNATVLSLFIMMVLSQFFNFKNAFVYAISIGTLLMIGFHDFTILILQ